MIDFTAELAELMTFTGRTATAIRMYSSYNQDGYKTGLFGGRRADPKRSPVDLMFLADALHHFERVGTTVAGGNMQHVIDMCDSLLEIFEGYSIEDRRFTRQAKPTFELWADLVELRLAKQALASMRNKARETQS